MNANGTFCALQNACPHAGASLGEGHVDGWSLECPLHGAVFDVRSGEALSGPADGPARAYAAKVEDGIVKVSVAASGQGVVLAGVDG